MEPKKLILFELNEVPYRQLDDFIKNVPDSNFAKLLSHSDQYTTEDEEIDQDKLSPWITWPTLHRGVSKKSHQILELGQVLDEPDAKYPPIWELISHRNIRVGVFSSLHTSALPKSLTNYDFFVPDPFSISCQCHPPVIDNFQEFNLSMSRVSARNVSREIPLLSAIKVILAAPHLGLRFRTFFRILQQLFLEIFKPQLKVRRRTFQSIMTFDVFYKQLDQKKPQFATYFTNHVASAMHRFWRAKYPEDYDLQKDQATKDWVQTYKNEIDWAMKQADIWLGRLLRFIDKNPDYRLILATSMGQKAVDYSFSDTEIYLDDTRLFMQKLGFNQDEWSVVPAMKPQINFRFSQEKAAKKFVSLCKKVSIKDLPLKVSAHGSHVSLDLGQTNVGPDDVKFQGRIVNPLLWGFKNMENDEKTSCTAYHSREGILLYYKKGRPPADRSRRVISTLSIAPSILNFFNLEIPDYMTSQKVSLD